MVETETETETTTAASHRAARARRRRWLIAGGLVTIAVLLVAVPTLVSFGRVQTVPLDSQGARERLADLGSGRATPGDDLQAASPVPDEGYRSFLVLGSDERGGLGGSRADVIIVGLLPADGSAPIMFSLPRDLWLPDPCHGGHSRINSALNGCGDTANGFELSAIVVEDFTGIPIDHVVGIDFEGFKQVIDAVGGVQICVQHPVREGRALELDAGCHIADGDTALRWARSRKTEEFVDGRWRTMPGVNDLTRNERQQDIMLQLLRRVGSFSTLSNLHGFSQGISDSVSRGSGLSVLDGARMAWGLRGEAGKVRRFMIPVTGTTTADGAQVLLPNEPFAETFEEAIREPLSATQD